VVIALQRAKRLDDEYQAAMGELGLLDQQLLALCLLLIGTYERITGQRPFGAVASSIAVSMKAWALCIALLNEATHRGQFLAAQLFLGVGVHQSALPALGICP